MKEKMIDWKDDGRIKLLIMVGTRPEVIRLSKIIKRCRECFDTLLAHTGQNYDYNLNEIFFREFDIDEPDVNLKVVGDNLGATIGQIIQKSYELMRELEPDALLILGDTNSCLSAISAKRLHIPIFHMEAGNRCKDECLPEETNRRIVDIISDVNLPYTEHARRYLLECGCAPERIFVTGSPIKEVLTEHIERIVKSDVLERISRETGVEIRKNGYFLLSVHREENIDIEENFESLFSALNRIVDKYDMPILYSCHPRSRAMLEKRGFRLDSRIIAHEPLGFVDYNALELNAYCVLSDSGTLPEECSYYDSIGKGFPAVCLRTSTERPEAMEKGKIIIAGVKEKGIIQAIDLAVNRIHFFNYRSVVDNYNDVDVSEKVIAIIQSYVGIVNSVVWRKQT